jgi:hypothetical protein
MLLLLTAAARSAMTACSSSCCGTCTCIAAASSRSSVTSRAHNSFPVCFTLQLLLLQVLLMLAVRSSSAVPRPAARTARHRIANTAAIQTCTVARAAFSLTATGKACTHAAVDLATDAWLQARLWPTIAEAHAVSSTTNLACTFFQASCPVQPMLLLLRWLCRVLRLQLLVQSSVAAASTTCRCCCCCCCSVAVQVPVALRG